MKTIEEKIKEVIEKAMTTGLIMGILGTLFFLFITYLSFRQNIVIKFNF